MDSDQDNYFKEYQNLEIHDIMLKDRPRQEAYRNAIFANKDIFKNKVVLDVGAGTGILSAFCAQAGARSVIAVEPTNLAEIAVEIMKENLLSSIVTVLQSKIEDVSVDLGKVDIIVSEWMGFYLLHEGMLDSIIYARDTFLVEDGILFPQEAMLYVSPCSLPSIHKYYEDVDGIKMSSFAEMLCSQKSAKLEICSLKEENLLAEGEMILYINLSDITLDDLKEIYFEHTMPAEKAGSFDGFCIWFDVRFPSRNLEDAVCLSTSPSSPETHWKQSVVVLNRKDCIDVELGEPISFVISLTRQENDVRKYNLEVQMLNPTEVEHPIPCSCYMTKCIIAKTHLETITRVADNTSM